MAEASPTVTVAGVADILGVSRQRAHELTRAEGFPEPAETTPLGRIWSRAEVEAWAERRRAAAQ